MTFFFEELRRSSGTFRVELAATVFYAVYLAAQWPALVQASDWIAIPVALLAICYPVKVALMAWLVANGGESWDFGRSRVLVTWGPYRWSRNPVYTVVLAQFAAWLFLMLVVAHHPSFTHEQWTASLLWATGGVAALGGFWAYASRVAVPREERQLLRDHPIEFAAYCTRVSRWAGWKSAREPVGAMADLS